VTCQYEEDFDEIDILGAELFDVKGFEDRTFDLTEDLHIDEHDSDPALLRLSVNRLEIQLLTSPLPHDLPTVQKDLLILMAAYYGDVDRYNRLRRPKTIPKEYKCCVRGIYHNTPFAVWWSRQPKDNRIHPSEAIAARLIMNNVLSGAPYKFPPYQIWWPQAAQATTYRRLADIQPEMLPQILHACMAANYTDLFDELLPRYTPNKDMVDYIATLFDPKFKAKLDARVKELGITLEETNDHRSWIAQLYNIREHSQIEVPREIDANGINTTWSWPYDGVQCEAGMVDTLVCLPPEWLLKADHPNRFEYLDYAEVWPPGIGGMDSLRSGGSHGSHSDGDGEATGVQSQVLWQQSPSIRSRARQSLLLQIPVLPIRARGAGINLDSNNRNHSFVLKCFICDDPCWFEYG